jgi:hypothetical protein
MIRFQFDSQRSAAQALKVVLEHARSGNEKFTFGGLSLASLTADGLWLHGDIETLLPHLEAVPGAVRQDQSGR